MNLTKTLAALLVVLAIVLALLAWMMGSPSEPAAPPVSVASPGPAPAAPLHAVVVAAQDIPAGQRLEAEHVKLAQLPAPVPGSFDHTDAVLGRSTRVALSPGTPLFEPQLVSGLALQITPGQRALAIAIKEPMSAGHHVRPGDFVDVFFTLDARNDPAAPDSQTRLLLARSRVLAYGQASVERPPLSAAQRQAQQEEAGARRGASTASTASTATTREDPAQRPENAQTAVLAVPLEDVERLTLAEKFGHLTLALRHPDDLSVPDPTLFAALPTALQPVAARLRGNAPLQGTDRAFAGLRFKDLAAGGQARASPRTAGRPVQQGPAPPRQASVEMHQGAAVQTVSY